MIIALGSVKYKNGSPAELTLRDCDVQTLVCALNAHSMEADDHKMPAPLLIADLHSDFQLRIIILPKEHGE